MIKKSIVVLWLTCSVISFSQEDNSRLMFKGNAGHGFHPFLLWYGMHDESPYKGNNAGGLSFNADIAYRLIHCIWLDINLASIPLYKVQKAPVKTHVLFFPISAGLHLDTGWGIYVDAGLGICFLHGSMESTDPRITFFDVNTGTDYGSVVSRTKGPFFNVNMGIGSRIPLTKSKRLGLDFCLRNYLIVGYKSLDETCDALEKETDVPATLMKIFVNCGAGLYFTL